MCMTFPFSKKMRQLYRTPALSDVSAIIEISLVLDQLRWIQATDSCLNG